MAEEPTSTNGQMAQEITTATEAVVGSAEELASVDDEQRESWDLLYIQDSHGFGVANGYAEGIERALGAEVNVHNKAIGDLSAVTVLERIRGDWSSLVRDAEIIVLFGNPRGSGTTTDIEICISGSTAEREPPMHYSEEDWQPYQAVLEEVYTEIWKIREGRPVVLRAVTFLNPAISAWREAGIEPECTAALEAMNQAISDAAEAGGATLVSTHDLFNGPDHLDDPRRRGWIGSDGIHLSNEGMTAVADALTDVGFETTTAPSESVVEVAVEGVEGALGWQLSGVLYPGRHFPDSAPDAVGGFAAEVVSDPFSTTSYVSQPGELGEGPFPYVSSKVLAVDPGTYTLMVYLDDELRPYGGMLPAASAELVGCRSLVEVQAERVTTVTVSGGFSKDLLSPCVLDIDAKVIFDGEACVYEGPTVVALNSSMTIEFDERAYPAALVVGHVRAGTTWEEVAEFADNNPAGSYPPYGDDAAPRIRTGSGSLVVPFNELGAYTLVCSTGPEDTNKRFPGAWIEVVES
jgi:hypothetical protein